MGWAVIVSMLPDGHGAVIASNSEELLVGSNASGLLGGWEVGKSGGTSSHLFAFLRDVCAGGLASLGWIPEDNLVIISRGNDLSVAGLKSPDFSFVVGVHDFTLFLVAVASSLADSSVAETDEKVPIFAVNCSDEVVERPFSLGGHACTIDFVDISVLTTTEEHAITEVNGADETVIVGFNSAHAFSIFSPRVNEGICTSSPADSLVAPSCAGERCLLASVIDTLVLVEARAVSIIELNVLRSSSAESVGGAVESNIVNLALSSLNLSFAIHSVSAVDVDTVVIVEINASNQTSITVESNGIDTSGSFGKFSSSFLLTSAGIPGEDYWGGANLSSGSRSALIADLEAHDVIGVSTVIVGSLF